MFAKVEPTQSNLENRFLQKKRTNNIRKQLTHFFRLFMITNGKCSYYPSSSTNCSVNLLSCRTQYSRRTRLLKILTPSINLTKSNIVISYFCSFISICILLPKCYQLVYHLLIWNSIDSLNYFF